MQPSITFEQAGFYVSDSHYVIDVDLSRGGNLVVAAEGNPNRVTLWNTATGSKTAVLEGYGDFVNSVTIHPDGHGLASGSDDGDVRFYPSMQIGSDVVIFPHGDRVQDMRFSPDGGMLASAGADRTIKIWDVKTQLLKAELTGHESVVKTISFSPDGKFLMSGSPDRTVRRWDVGNGTLLKTYPVADEDIAAVAYNPDGNWMASCGEDSGIQFINVTNDGVQVVHTYDTACCCVFVRPSLLVVGYYREDFVMKLWNAENGQVMQTIKGSSDEITSIAFDRNTDTLVCGGAGRYGGTLELWRLKPSEEI